MKGEDIDKIFKEALGQRVAPTSEEDWKQFESMLSSKGRASGWWISLLLLLLLTGGAWAGYTLFKGDDGLYIARKSHAQIESVELTVSAESAVSTESAVGSESAESTESAETGEIHDGKQDLTESESIEKNDTDQEEARTSSIGTAASEKSGSDQNKATVQAGLAGSQLNAEKTVGLNESLAINTSPKPLELIDEGQADTEATSSKNTPIPETGTFVSREGEWTPAPEFSTMPMIDAGPLDRESAPLLSEENREKPEAMGSKYRFSGFMEIAQNNVLKTNFAIGMAIHREIYQSGKDHLALEIGLGYRRSGRLTWTQEREEVSYGFDRYVSQSTLKTNQLDMLHLPFRVVYRRGIHNLFLGAEGNFLLHASQEFQQSPEGPEEEGYLYSSLAPDFSLFFTGGYGICLTERIRLDLGGRLGANTWKSTGERPLGGYIKLNYFIR